MLNRLILSLTLALGSTALATAAPSILTIKETITDTAIVYPESFETDTHKMMQNWYLQNYTDLDREADLRPLIEVSDQVYIDRLSHMPTIIEMPFNQVVKSYIEMYTQKRRSLVENMLGMSLYYMPIFEQALEREGLPLELKYLPVIESALNPDAVSRAGATGLWQFMLPTARGLSLEVNSLVDERRDPVRSSEAAAKYLKQLYDIYGDWSLAIAAYNCGPGNVNKALRRAGGDSSNKDFWTIYPLLPQETRGYVPCFIAANYAMNYYKEHNISPALARKPIITDTVEVNKRVHFDQISNVLNIPIEEITVLNPQFRQNVIPGDIHPYKLVLPSHQVCSYVMSEDSILAYKASEYTRRTVVEPATYASTTVSSDGEYVTEQVVKYHKVRRGETLTSIARKYGVTVNAIKRTNKVKRARRGQTLKIVTTRRVKIKQDPVVEETAVPATEVAADNNVAVDADDQRQEVTDDATVTTEEALGVELEEAAQPVDTPVQVEETAPAPAPAKEANASPKERRVKKPEANKPATQPAANKTVTVRKGDSLDKIARRNGTTVKELRRLNSNLQGDKIKPGQKIRVK